LHTAGTYSFTVTDANGCTGTGSITLTQPSVLTASSTLAAPVLCNGGNATITVNAAGGTPSYAGTGSFSAPAGPNSYTVTDANGCTASTSITVSQPTAVVVSAIAGTIICNGGNTTVTVSATGGTGSYSGTGTFTVVAGTHSYTVTDANGWVGSTSITVTEPTPVSVNASYTPIACNGGATTVTVTATGGAGGYAGTGTYTRTAGTYLFGVVDANGCAGSTTITITEPTAITVTASAGSIA
jgi:hypothetical protein